MKEPKTCPNCSRPLGDLSVMLRVRVKGGEFTKTVCGDCFKAEHEELLKMGARLANTAGAA